MGDKGEGGVKNLKKWVTVIYGQPIYNIRIVGTLSIFSPKNNLWRFGTLHKFSIDILAWLSFHFLFMAQEIMLPWYYNTLFPQKYAITL